MDLLEPVAEDELGPHGGSAIHSERCSEKSSRSSPRMAKSGRPHWPVGASFSPTSMERLARNAFITLERHGTTWTLGPGSRVEGML